MFPVGPVGDNDNFLFILLRCQHEQWSSKRDEGLGLRKG